MCEIPGKTVTSSVVEVQADTSLITDVARTWSVREGGWNRHIWTLRRRRLAAADGRVCFPVGAKAEGYHVMVSGLVGRDDWVVAAPARYSRGVGRQMGEMSRHESIT